LFRTARTWKLVVLKSPALSLRSKNTTLNAKSTSSSLDDQ
jgi:hypothetical protein